MLRALDIPSQRDKFNPITQSKAVRLVKILESKIANVNYPLTTYVESSKTLGQ